MKSAFRRKFAAAALAVTGLLGASLDSAAQSANEIFVPVLVYRTGAYAPNGVPWADGFVDYLKLVNARDGGDFKYVFPMLGTYWDAADILVQHVKKKGNLKGKKIALVYHDSPYGKEPIPVLEALAKREGFELLKLPVTCLLYTSPSPRD